jgi:hypothetical protein
MGKLLLAEPRTPLIQARKQQARKFERVFVSSLPLLHLRLPTGAPLVCRLEGWDSDTGVEIRRINFDDFLRAAIVGYARGDGES